MRHTSTRTVEWFRHNGQRYKRIEEEEKIKEEGGGEVEWVFFNTGWGETGWFPVSDGGEEIVSAETLEAMYQDL